MKEKKGDRIRVGIAGEHFAAAELSRHGWVVTITSKNTPHIDIIGRKGATDEFVAIQVKSRSTYKYAWRVSDAGPCTDRDFFVFVDLIDEIPDYWIVPSTVVASKIRSEQVRTKDLTKFRRRWNLLDRDERSGLSAPLTRASNPR